MRTKIRKAKIKDMSLFVELDEFVDVPGGGSVTNEVTKNCANLAHDDLVKAFNRLKVHMVKICDFKKSDDITRKNIDEFDIDLLEEYNITGFSLGGSDESSGVTIVGNRKFDSGKVLNIVTPFTRFVDDNDQYEFGSELASDIEACTYEVGEYVFNGKCAFKQLEMDFEGEVEGEADYKVSMLSDDGEAVDVDMKRLKRMTKRKAKPVSVEAV